MGSVQAEVGLNKHTAAAHDYAERVAAGEVPACKWVRLACERHLRDVENQGSEGFPFVWDEDRAADVCDFIELQYHIKGEWARRKERIKLEPWQQFVLCSAFGWVHQDTGLRRFRTVYIEVPRKNAKSTLSSAVGLYGLAADGEAGAEVYSAATTRDQARIVFQDAQNMARRNKEMCVALGINVGAHNIHVLATASKFEALSAEANSLDGLNPHLPIIDELHAHKTRSVYDVLESATGAREQSLLWLITTAGSDRSGVCYEVRTYVSKILDRVTEDETFFGVIWTIDDGDDWTEPASWEKANPNWNVSVKPDDMARLARKAMETPSAVNNFLTKRLNVWVNADVAWMDMRAWDRCSDPALRLEDFEGEPVIVGIDLASRVDIAALRLVFHREGEFYAFGRYYLPEETIETSTNSQYSGWVRMGKLVPTPGNIIDFGYIEDDLRDLSGRFEIKHVAFDPFQATQFSTRMMAEGFPMVEVGATVKNFSEPMKQMEALVLAGKYHHDGDPVQTWMVSNVVAHMDAKDNIYPRKERVENKIDGVVSDLMALNLWMRDTNEVSVYETRGVLTV